MVDDVAMSTENVHPAIVLGSPEGFWDTGTLGRPDWVKVMVAASWAKYLNPTMLDENRTIFSEFAKSAGLWNSPAELVLELNPVYVVESILSILTANGISRSTFHSQLVGALKDRWEEQFLPQRSKMMGPGGSVFDISDSERATSTEFTMTATVNGYAYSADGKAQKAAIVALLLYVVLALSHLAYSMWTGNSSSSWDSVADMTALAMNSRSSQRLQNTGAGIETPAVYKSRVRIRDDEVKVNVAFDDTFSGTLRLQANKTYG